MKRCIFIALSLLIAGVMFAQNRDPNNRDPSMIGIDTAQQEIREISVDKFEHDSYWRGVMSSDQGFITVRLFEGNPEGKEPIPGEEGLAIDDRHVLGAKVDFLRRGHATFYLYPRRPIPIEGITKSLSIWAVGRNFNHTLKVLIQDLYGRSFELTMGKLNFQGWQKLSVAIPPQPLLGRTGIVQKDYNLSNNMGIKIAGFKVECDPTETIGTYYFYLDDLRAITDLFAENSRDPDDMNDAW